jgi:predicted O-methyltransferase YrrM
MMTIERWTEVDRYYANLLLPVDAALEAALRASYEAGLPPVNVSPQQGKMLMLLAQSRGAQSILEIGTLGGYSAIWLARALAGKGRVVTLEANPNHADVARINIANAGLAEMVDLRVGKALDTLPQLASEGLGPFDLIFIDADKANNTSYFEWSLKLSRRGTLIIADNVVRDGAVIDSASEDPSVQGIRRFNERVAAEPRVSATAIQTVGSKGYDGFVIALVTAD